MGKIENVLLWVLLYSFLTASAFAATLIPLNAGMQMTCQFVNNTGGQYSNSQIYVLAIALNTSNQFCTLDATGAMTPCVSGQNASSFSIPLSSMNGFQFPATMSSGRLYVSLGTPLNIPFNTAGNGTVGIAYPNIDNPSDPNINSIFDWIEFTVANNAIWCNTTQVDMFGIPMLMQLYTGSASSYSLYGTVGITQPSTTIMSEYTAAVPTAFAGLESGTRIVAPIHGSFAAGGANAGYFDSYIASVWSEYTTTPLVITLGSTTYSGLVNTSGVMVFTDPGDANTYSVSQPTTNDVWGGSGALATGNSVELALEAQICAAFHRHVIDNAANLNNVSAYYQTAPCDYYAKFWHQVNVGNVAYGFCYDDVNNQSSTLSSGSPVGLVITIGGGAPGTPTVTPLPTASPTPSSIWRVNAGGPAYTDSVGNLWAADENYSGGTAAVTVTAISSTPDPTLYQTQRWGNPFTYTFSVPAGSYQVTLDFAETYWTGVGDRVFNVSINGSTALSNLDIFAACGGADKALQEVFNNVQPSGGAISIAFGPASADNAEVNAIQIIPMPTASPTPTLSKTASSTPSRTDMPSSTLTDTGTFTLTDTPSLTQTLTSTFTRTATPSPSQTYPSTPTRTDTPSLTQTYTATFTRTGTPSLTRTLSPSPMATATLTPSPTVTPSGSMTDTLSATDSPTLSASPTDTVPLTKTQTEMATVLQSPSASTTATASPGTSPSLTQSPTLSAVSSHTNTQTLSSTPSLSPSRTPSVSPTVSATQTFTAISSPTGTVSATPSTSPTISVTSSRSVSPSFSVTDTLSATDSPTLSATPATTVSPTTTQTETVTDLQTLSASPSLTASPWASPSSTQTPTLSAVPSHTITQTLSATPSSPSPSPTPTLTTTPTSSSTLTVSQTSSPSPSRTPSLSPTLSATQTFTGTLSPTRTISATPSPSLTLSLTSTPSSSASPTQSQTQSAVFSPAPSATSSPLPNASATPTSLALASLTATPTIKPDEGTPVPGTVEVLKVVPVPNPQTGPNLGFDVEMLGTASQLEISLYSVSMVEIGSWVVQGDFSSGWNRFSINVGYLPAGLYYVLCGPVPAKAQDSATARLMIVH